MGKIDIHRIHNTLEGLGIPVDSVHLHRDGKTVELSFLAKATTEQKENAQKIVDEWDQDVLDAEKATAIQKLPTIETISAAKTAKELQAMALQLRDYIDQLKDN